MMWEANMYKKFSCVLSYHRDWDMKRDICYYYPLNEVVYEDDPTKDRTMEISEFQDGLGDIETRETEWEVFEERVAKLVEEAISNNKGSGNAGANPDRHTGTNSY